MPILTPPPSFRFPSIVTEVAEGDTMYAGQDRHYLSVGLSALRIIEDALGEGAPAPRRILDLPCGHGRVTRVLRARFPEAAITVCDLDRGGVDFAAARFGARGVYSVEDFRALDLGETYDLIWVGSLVTHLCERDTRRFLDCMARHMTPESTLIVSSHGVRAEARVRATTYGIAPEEVPGLLEEYARTGYGYRDYPGARGYGVSLVGRDWAVRTFSEGPFRLDGYAEAAWDDHQDVLVLRLREDDPGPSRRLLADAATEAQPRPDRAVARDEESHAGRRIRATGRRAARAGSTRLRGWIAGGRGAAATSAAGTDAGGTAAEQRTRPHEAPPADPAEAFDESWYLASYPDVAEVVATGEFASGHAHYVNYGRREGRLPSAAAASGLIAPGGMAYASGGPEASRTAMQRPPTTSLSLLFPPARRLYAALRQMQATVGALAAEQGRLAAEQGRLVGEVERLSGAVSAVRERAQAAAVTTTAHEAPPPPAPLAPTPLAPTPLAPAADAEAALDRLTARYLQAAALRHMPFLPGEIAVRADAIEVTGYCGAPEGLTAAMAFFVNGRRFDRVEYPVLDPALKAKFAEEPGMGFVFRARMTEHLDELRAARFLRFEAAPTGRHVPADWRRAVHFMNPAHERFPLPPVPNIQRVIGDTSQVRFAMGGAMIFKNLEAYLGEQLGLGWADFPRILDWGCGAGRVTRYFLSETPAAVTGVDIDPDNIAWCRSAYPGGDFQVVPLRPPTGFADGTFDLVTGLSVLTHLSEDDQWAWLSELRRITRPGALLFLSVQGPTQFAYNSFPPKLYRKLQEVGYIDFSRDPALDQVIEDPEYYRAAMHSRPYIVGRWGEFFEVVAIVDAIAGLQDFVVLRRRG